MPGLEIVIVDLTREVISVGVFDVDSVSVRVLDELSIPSRVVLKEQGDSVAAWAGEDAASLPGDAEALDFDNLHMNLMRIENEELQILLVSALWKSLCASFDRCGLLNVKPTPVGCIVVNHTWPSSLVELLRRACAAESRIKLIGVLNETTSLLIGIFQSKQLEQAFRGRRAHNPSLLCAVVAYDDASLDVVCFNYSFQAGTSRIFIREYLHTTCSDLYGRLSRCDWLPALSSFILLESAGLSTTQSRALRTTLSDLYGDGDPQRYVCKDTRQLKMQGAGLIARSFAGQGALFCDYELGTAYNIGLRINYERFYPLLARKDLAVSKEFPLTAIQAFSLRGSSGGEVRVNLYCGYSDAVEEATPLGSASISGAHLEKLLMRDPPIIVAMLRMDSPGSGEFMIGIPPDGQVITSLPFTLPALVV